MIFNKLICGKLFFGDSYFGALTPSHTWENLEKEKNKIICIFKTIALYVFVCPNIYDTRLWSPRLFVILR